MRQSPSLLALLTLSATLGIATQARGETVVAVSPQSREGSVRVADLVAAETFDSTIAATPTVPVVDALATEETAPRFSRSRTTADEDAVEPAAATDSPEEDTRLLATQDRARDRWVAVAELSGVAAEDATADISPAIQPNDAIAQSPPEEAEPDTDAEAEDETEEAGPPAEPQVLVAEVSVTDPEGSTLSPDLTDRVYEAVTTRPGQTTTRSQIQQDINNIFATGFFANVRAVPTDTPLGVRVTFVVQPNPVLTRVSISGNDVLPQEVVDEIFADQYGEIINLLDFQDGILELNEWYQRNGYVLAQVVAAPQVSPDGEVTLLVAEGVIESIEVRFLTDEGLAEDEEGNPLRGRTREFIITRELQTQPGDVFQQSRIQSDLQRVFALGLFDDVNITLNPGDEDPRKVKMVLNVVERGTGSVAAGLGFNFTGDVFGTLSYRQDNFGGNNQKFSAETQLSTRDILFDISFTDPWIGGDPNRTSYTANGFARRSIPLTFDGGPNEVNLPNGDRVRLTRYGTGITFRRPIGNAWQASVGTQYQRIRVVDSDGQINTVDELGNPLSLSGNGADDLLTFQAAAVRDTRNDPFNPTSGTVIRFGTEQSVPIGESSILLNRLRASYSQYFPLQLFGSGDGAQALAFNIQGGTVLGDLPPYEAFSLGGTNSVRGYDEGEIGSGRSYLQATAEYRFPLFSFLGGALFVDYGTDLGTGNNVPGSPGPLRGKPGNGFGYGAGVRVQTPLGPIRVDYGFNDQGEGRLHFGIGERF